MADSTLTSLGAPQTILPNSGISMGQSSAASPLSDVTSLNPSMSGFNDPLSGVNLGATDTGLSTDIGNLSLPSNVTQGLDSLGGGNTSGLLSSLGSLLSSSGINSNTLSGLGPYLGVAGYGIYQANQSQKQNNQLAGQVGALGQPFTDAARQQLTQYNSGQLLPNQQKAVDLATAAGQSLIDSGAMLSTIAQQAFAQYNSGQLNPADQVKLDQQVAAQKQQVRQMLSQQGIADSTVLAGYDQQIDNQALMTKQSLLDARFATGDQAYNQWLTSTTQGQQLQIQAQQYATQQFQQMLSDAMGLGSTGMQPMEQAVALQIQGNDQLSQQVSQLLGNLAAAYAYQQGKAASAQGGGAGSGSTAGASGAGSTLNKLLGGGSAAGPLAGLDVGAINSQGAAAAAPNAGDLASLTGDVSNLSLPSNVLSGLDTSGVGGAAAGSLAGLSTPAISASAVGPGAADLASLQGSAAGATLPSSAGAGLVAGSDAGSGASLSGMGALAGAGALLGTAAIGYELTKGDSQSVTPLPGANVQNVGGQNFSVVGNMGYSLGNDAGSGGLAVLNPQTGKFTSLGKTAANTVWDSLKELSTTQDNWNAIRSGDTTKQYGAGNVYLPISYSQFIGNANKNLQSVYNKAGGQSALGVDFNTWVGQMKQLFSSVNQGSADIAGYTAQG